MKRKSSPNSGSDASHIQSKRARLGWLDEIDPPKPMGQDQAGPSNYRPSSLSDLYEDERLNQLDDTLPLPQSLPQPSQPPQPPTLTLTSRLTRLTRLTSLSTDLKRDAAKQRQKRFFLCALCTSLSTEGLQLWRVSEEGSNHMLTVHQHCIENIPEISIATADGFVGWAVVMDSQRFRRRFNLVRMVIRHSSFLFGL
jgi:hypothetical protein